MATKPKITKNITKVNFSDSNRSKKQIKYIVRHYIGATGGAKANTIYFKNEYRGASAHYFIGHRGEIWQSVEERNIAWHCGAKTYKHKACRNSNSIGVEMCVKKDKRGNWYYTEETKKAAIKLFAYLMDKYEIDVNHILRHYDVTGKICGEPDVRSGSNVWSSFKKAIKGYGIKNTMAKNVKASKVKTGSYLVQTTCDALNIRNGAGTSYRINGIIREKVGKKNTYTIVEKKNGWGRLKSGVGWIYLKYTKRV